MRKFAGTLLRVAGWLCVLIAVSPGCMYRGGTSTETRTEGIFEIHAGGPLEFAYQYLRTTVEKVERHPDGTVTFSHEKTYSQHNASLRGLVAAMALGGIGYALLKLGRLLKKGSPKVEPRELSEL